MEQRELLQEGTMEPIMKPVRWIGSSSEELSQFPAEVRRNIGYAIHFAQIGDKHPSARPLQGFGGASVLEVVEDYAGDTYRTVYTVRLAGAIYVLHAFKKKARRGIKTPKQDIDLIKARLKRAQDDHRERQQRNDNDEK